MIVQRTGSARATRIPCAIWLSGDSFERCGWPCWRIGSRTAVPRTNSRMAAGERGRVAGLGREGGRDRRSDEAGDVERQHPEGVRATHVPGRHEVRHDRLRGRDEERRADAGDHGVDVEVPELDAVDPEQRQRQQRHERQGLEQVGRRHDGERPEPIDGDAAGQDEEHLGHGLDGQDGAPAGRQPGRIEHQQREGDRLRGAPGEGEQPAAEREPEAVKRQRREQARGPPRPR